MLTKSKVLSNTGVEIGGSKLSSIVNNNINIVSDKANPYDAIATESPPPDVVTEPSTEKVVKYSSQEDATIEFLKKIIALYSTNTLKIEGKLVLHNDELVDLIRAVINANYPELTEVAVDIKVEYEVNCCGASKGLNVINKILINQVHDMKYVYNKEYNSLMQYGISLKYTLD